MQIIIVRFAYRFIYCIEFKVRRLTRKIHYRFNAHGCAEGTPLCETRS